MKPVSVKRPISVSYTVIRILEVANRGKGVERLCVAKGFVDFYKKANDSWCSGDVIRVSVAIQRTKSIDLDNVDGSIVLVGRWNTVKYGPNLKDDVFQDSMITEFSPTYFRAGDDKYEMCDTCSEYKIMPHQIGTCFDCTYESLRTEP